jgi:hypothetical protein
MDPFSGSLLKESKIDSRDDDGNFEVIILVTEFSWDRT